MEVLRFGIFLKCVFHWVSVTDFFKSNLFESPTNYMCSKVISIFFYIQRVVLKLHLDGNLIFFKLGFTPCKAKQPLQGMELLEKEAQKDHTGNLFSRKLQLTGFC